MAKVVPIRRGVTREDRLKQLWALQEAHREARDYHAQKLRETDLEILALCKPKEDE